jgi:hypothetical protein
MMSTNSNTQSPVPLVGTWKLNIDRSKTNLPPFLSLHTYFADGTMTETTSELGKGGEGPGHGVWQGQSEDYEATFELFLFSDCGEFTGTAQVRTVIHLDDPDHISGQAIVDLIAPDGRIEANIDVSPFEGTRVKVIPIGM